MICFVPVRRHATPRGVCKSNGVPCSGVGAPGPPSAFARLRRAMAGQVATLRVGNRSSRCFGEARGSHLAVAGARVREESGAPA